MENNYGGNSNSWVCDKCGKTIFGTSIAHQCLPKPESIPPEGDAQDDDFYPGVCAHCGKPKSEHPIIQEDEQDKLWVQLREDCEILPPKEVKSKYLITKR